MMHVRKILALGAVLVASATVASATPVSGNATVFGFDTFATPATGITFTAADGSIPVGGPVGTLVGSGTITSGTVNLNSFTFATATGVTLFSNATESFVLSGPVSVISQIDGTFLNVAGMGTFNEAGFTPTSGSFTLTSTKQGNTSFTFDSTLATAVTPEPSSLILLGTGLVSSAGMLLRRRRTA